MPSKWDDRPYSVGKGKPPVHSRFGQEGRAPNRKGRVRGAKNADTIIESALSSRVSVTENGTKRTISKLEAIVTQLVNRAAGGDLKAIDSVLRIKRDIEGRPEPDAAAIPLAEEDRSFLEQYAARLRDDGKGTS